VKISMADIIKWIKRKKVKYVNARRIAKEFNTDPRLVGKILSYLSKLGALKLYKKRKGRFSIYQVESTAIDKIDLKGFKGKKKKFTT